MWSREAWIEAAIRAAPDATGWKANLIAQILLAVDDPRAEVAIRSALSRALLMSEAFWSLEEWAAMDVVERSLLNARIRSTLISLALIESHHLDKIVNGLQSFDLSCPTYGLSTTLLIEKAPDNELASLMTTFPANLWLDELFYHLRGVAQAPEFYLAERIPLRPEWAPETFSILVREMLGGAFNKGALCGTMDEYLFPSVFDWNAGLLNRSLLNRLDHWIFLIDIDHIRTVNDQQGLYVGDSTIRSVIQALQEIVGDRVIRYGGDEFVVLLELEAGEETAEILRAHVEARTQVTISLGGVMTTGDAEADIREADERLMQAKREGRNRVLL